MAFQLFDVTEDDSLNTVLVSVIAEITMICATALVFFAYLKLPILLATSISLFIFFIATLLCWRSFVLAQAVFFVSLMVCELVLSIFFDWMIAGFLVFDFITIVVFMRMWQPKDENRS